MLLVLEKGCSVGKEGGRPQGTTQQKGYDVSSGRPQGTTQEKGYNVGKIRWHASGYNQK